MKKLVSTFFVLFILLNGIANAAFDNLQKITDQLYMITNFGGNVAFLVTETNVVVVDAGSYPYQGKEIMDMIRSVTNKPIEYIIITHCHYDHTNGLQSFPKSAKVLAYKNTAENFDTFLKSSITSRLEELPKTIAELDSTLKVHESQNSPDVEATRGSLEWHKMDYDNLKTVELVYPDTIITGNTTLKLGGEEIEIIYPGGAHTNGNLIVYFKSQKTIHMGDILFNKFHPYVDWKAGADVANWKATLDSIYKLNPEIVIPGHGELTDKDALMVKKHYLEDMESRVQACIDKGISLNEIMKQITVNDFEGIGFDWMLPRTIEGVYMNLTKK